MNDLISRQDAICAVCRNCLRTDLEVLDGCLGKDCSIKPVLESLPSVDLVMCGECKFNGKANCAMKFKKPPTDFCSYGERKESDTVEVVRCKDCKHWKIKNDGFGECNVMDKQFLGEEYCSYGERKEDND